MIRVQPDQRRPTDDPRVLRSQGLLRAAILELGREGPIDGVAISDITGRAGVSRSTFYDHYTDKETLLADAIERQALDAGISVREAGLADGLPDQPPSFLIDYVQHIADHAELYRNVLGEYGSATVHARLARRMASILVEGYQLLGEHAPAESSLPIEVDAAALAGAVLAVLAHWLEHLPRTPPSVVASWIWEIVGRE
ncbi:TetR/AcrR family transcriptional regulator [Nocardia sp. NPDC058176]|uniref:TetR/AcrR family transcriptional regulator n=1 Tax=Nocardia sp. NPDC058176 TaxID=3346368 RepID=UPI0036DA26FD